MGLKKLLVESITWRGFYFFSILLVNVFLSRYLHAANTGHLYFLTLIFSFLHMLLSLSAESAIIYFASGNIISRNKLIGLMGLWSLITGIITIACIYMFFSVDASVDKALLNTYCIYGFLYVSGQCFANYSLAVYYTKEDYFIPNFLLGIVNIAFVIIIPAKNHLTDARHVQMVMYLFFATYFIGGLLAYIVCIIRNRKEGAFGFPDKKNLNLFLKYSITSLAANIVFFLVYKVDYAFVKYSPVCTAADLGNYIQVSKLGQMMLIIPQIIASVVFPRTASGLERMRINNVIMVMTRIFSQIFLLAFIVVAATGSWLFVQVFGESFNKMQIPMLLIMPGIFMLSVSALLSAHFSGNGKVKVNLYGAILAVIVMITGDYFFVLPYGIIAAAAVSTLSYLMEFSYILFQFYKDNSISWLEFIKWKKSDYNFLFTIIKSISQ